MDHPSARPRTLTVHPGRAPGGSFAPPGDKSITHRALILAALARGESRIDNRNPGADCESTLQALAALGVGFGLRDGTLVVAGSAGRLAEPDRPLDCGNSGTTLRLLAGVVAAQSFLTVLMGDASLHRRPVARIVEPLRRMGAELWARAECLPPLVVRGGPLRGIHHSSPVASAQVASCLLLAGLAAEGITEVELPGAARDHTERMLPVFGVTCEVEDHESGGRLLGLLGPAALTAARVRVPGDLSAASFALAAAAASPGSRVTARDVGLNPTRTGLLDALASMGAGVLRERERVEGGEPVGDVTVTGPERLEAFDVPAAWLPRMIDEVPAWVIAAAAADGTSTLAGAGELRVKESDRLAALTSNLSRLGVTARETADGMTVTGGPVRGGDVPSYGDHRIAMAFALLGARSQAPVTVTDTDPIGTSYPAFARDLAALGVEVEADEMASRS